MITQHAPDTDDTQDPLKIELHSEELQSNDYFNLLNASCEEWSKKSSSINTKQAKQLGCQQHLLYHDHNTSSYSITLTLHESCFNQKQAWEEMPRFVEDIKTKFAILCIVH